MTTCIDTNVISHVLDSSSLLHDWSVEELEKCKLQGPVIVPDIVYCELSIGMSSQQHLDVAIRELALERIRSSDAALVRAGVAFKTYRDKNKGPKLGVLPDFLIGATAESLGAPLLTANPKDFVGYFPNLKTIVPPASSKR